MLHLYNHARRFLTAEQLWTALTHLSLQLELERLEGVHEGQDAAALEDRLAPMREAFAATLVELREARRALHWTDEATRPPDMVVSGDGDPWVETAVRKDEPRMSR